MLSNIYGKYGEKLIKMINDISRDYGLDKNFIAGGIQCSPYYLTFDQDGHKLFRSENIVFSRDDKKRSTYSMDSLILLTW